jgi:hypothetical protein
VNESGPESIDWATVLASAHRRLAIRLGVLAAIGGVGAILLLGGGAATRGAVHNSDGDDSTSTSGPDLIIAPIEGSTIRIENAGGAGAGEFEVLVQIDGESAAVDPPELGGLDAGASKDFAFECHEGTVMVVVRDPEASGNPGMEDERSESISCEEGEMSLTIYIEGTTVFVENTGSSSVGGFNLSVESPEGAEVGLDETSFGELPPGGKETANLYCESETSVTVTATPIEGSTVGPATGDGTCGETSVDPNDPGDGSDGEGDGDLKPPPSEETTTQDEAG